MNRVWQWAWDRYGSRYSWAVLVLSYLLTVPMWVFTAIVIVMYEESDQFVGPPRWPPRSRWLLVIPRSARFRCLAPHRAMGGGRPDDRQQTLESTYAFARSFLVRGIVIWTLAGGMMWPRLVRSPERRARG